MSPSRYLLLAGVTFCTLFALAVLDAWAQAGAPTRHGYYTCSYIRAKIERGAAVSSPKLVIISGSNALMGIDTEELTSALSIHAYNFGLAASFGPGFQTFEASKILRRGDAVLMPFEYLAYDYSTPRDSLIDAVYSCGVDYWQSLDWRQKLFFVMAAKPLRLIDSLVFRSNTRAMAAVAAQATADVGRLGQRLGPGAPMRVVAGDGQSLSGSGPLVIHFDADSAGARAIADFVAWSRAHGVRVFATWPNTRYYRQYANDAAFEQIRDFYRKLGVDVVGAPQDSMFANALMGDTIYHLNRTGIRIRTAKLVQALRKDRAFAAWQRLAGSRARVSAN